MPGLRSVMGKKISNSISTSSSTGGSNDNNDINSKKADDSGSGGSGSSGTTGTGNKKDDLFYSSRLTPEGDYIPDGKFDCSAFVIYCGQHQKVAASRPEETGAVWLPFTPLPAGKSWKEGTLAGALAVLASGIGGTGSRSKYLAELKENPPFDQIQCMQLFRLQLPSNSKFVTRLICFIPLKVEASCTYACCQDTRRITWIPMDDILSCFVENLWGPEFIEFGRMAQSAIVQQVCEYSLEEAFYFVPRDPPRNLEESMLKSAQITEKDVERLYADFIDHCFPSFYQTLESFKCYMESYGFEKCDQRLTLLFNAFNFYQNGFLSFHELLLGLAAIEPNTVHGESRVRFVFRYYDPNGNGYLTTQEFRRIIVDMNPEADAEQIEQKLNEALQIIGVKMSDAGGQPTIAADDFVMAVGSHKFRGTSNLCRSSKPIFTQISRTIAARRLKLLATKENFNAVIRKGYRDPCKLCKEKEYTVATHCVKINPAGIIVEPQQIVEVRPSTEEFSAQRYSVEYVFNRNSAANMMIKLCRRFCGNKGTNKAPKGLLQDKPAVLWKLLLALYSDIDVLLREEDKCPRLEAPCFVFGDIHGNLDDLLTLEKHFWRRQPCVGANFLFLGDYVDRGCWGVECCLYLVAFKILNPNKVTLLRGNHEVRNLQSHYTYQRECLEKYGDMYGLKIWETTNKIFDKLPVSAILDDAIFCAHGGIPRSTKLVSDINKIKKELRDPENEAPIAWEILWSDPCHSQQFIEMCNFMRIDFRDTEGFLANIKRGTAYQFNEFGAAAFLKRNRMTHIIRAHEVPLPGYAFHFGTMCATVFSCSHYCGNNNDCACILAVDQVLRVIHLDTVNNPPATD